MKISSPEKIVLDKMSTISSLTANFIHSLDAMHMRKVILSLGEQGIEDFWAVHDCFGTHSKRCYILEFFQ